MAMKLSTPVAGDTNGSSRRLLTYHVTGLNFPTARDLLHESKDGYHDAKDKALEKMMEAVDTQALAFACMQAAAETDLPRLKIFDVGGFNAVILATFLSGKDVIARLPLQEDPNVIASTVATMAYAQHCVRIPCPTVLAWNNNLESVVGWPYILMEMAKGERLDDVWKNLELKRQVRVLHAVGTAYARLSEPRPLEGFGRLFFDQENMNCSLEDERSYRVKSMDLYRSWSEDVSYVQCSPGPTDSIRTLWRDAYFARWAAISSRWGSFSQLAEIKEEDLGLRLALERGGIISWTQAEDIAKKLLYIIDNIPIPRTLSRPCLVHSDFAFRNVMVSPRGKYYDISAILDWDEVVVLPEVLLRHDLVDFRRQSQPQVPAEPVSLMRSLIGGFWYAFEGKPNNWYRTIPTEEASFLVQDHILGIVDSLESAYSGLFAQIFLQMLRLFGFSNHLVAVPGANGFTTMWQDSCECVDAWKVYDLLRVGYAVWFREAAWISEKAKDLENRMSKPKRYTLVFYFKLASLLFLAVAVGFACITPVYLYCCM